jgi:glycosyltransferase involved in cell wall biosynthesis
MKVSVIIPNHNYAAFISQAVESVLGQTYKDFEIIVVDNGSTDNSLQILKSYPEVRIIQQENRGQTSARDVGVRASDGDLISFLDADDFWHPDKLMKQIDRFDEGVEFVTCNLFYVDEKSEILNEFHYPFFRYKFSRMWIDHPGMSIVEAGESAVLFSRKLYNELGGLDLSLNSGGGWDFFRRCANITNFVLVEEPLVYYRQHGNNMSNNFELRIKEFIKCYRKIALSESLDFIDGLKLFAKIDMLVFKTLILNRLSIRSWLEMFQCSSLLFFVKRKFDQFFNTRF